jgi:NAD(P)H dehydrogenase (quinone)
VQPERCPGVRNPVRVGRITHGICEGPARETGPAYSTTDAAGTQVTRRPIQLVSVSDAGLTDLLQRAGVPESFARVAASGDAHARAGVAEVTSDILERLSRRQPRSLDQFLRANKHVLVA